MTELMAIDRQDSNPRRAEELTALAHAALAPVAPVCVELGKIFSAHNYELYLVGGSVRDALMGTLATDLDFTTNAHPEEISRLLADIPRATVWDIGRAFGTIGAQIGDYKLEITTFRSDIYDGNTRKPEVEFGTSLAEDLIRRDFTINSIALKITDRGLGELHDPLGGIAALTSRIIDTPGEPQASFRDDPLRMLRAIRFHGNLDFKIHPRVLTEIHKQSKHILRISAERIASELDRIMLSNNPVAAIDLLCSTGLAQHIIPEIPAMQMMLDEHHQHKDVYTHSLTVLQQAIDREDAGPDLVLRWAAILHDIGKPATRKLLPGGRVSFHHHEIVGAKQARHRLRALKYPKAFTEQVCGLISLHLRFYGYGNVDWTDAAVRRYVTDAGPLLNQLHKLVRADCTTRNKRKARALQSNYDDLLHRIAELETQESLAKIRPELDGVAIMNILNIPAGPVVGKAWNYLKELRLEQGELGQEEAKERLLQWWQEQNK